jgi:hypothetical protein
MASGDNEHRMLFDLRGRRRNVVKVVYATLAVLMGLSLFLVIGGFNIAELFNDNTSTGDAAKPYEEQAERIEAKLKKDPQDPKLLVALTRAQVGAGNAQVEVDANGSRSFTLDAVQEYQKAYNTWSEYLKAVDQPEVGVALLMAPTLLQLAELSRTYEEASQRVKAASDAQRIVAEQRPSLNAWSTLAFYTYFTGDFAAAEKARDEAEKLAGEKAARESLGKQLDEYKKNAEKVLKEKAQAEKAQKTGGGAGEQGGAPESLENPVNPFGSGGGLSE